MHIGDGCLSNKKNEFRLKGNKFNEKNYYNNFVKKVYKQLFNLDIAIREYDSTYGFELYSKAIHEFKSKIVGLPLGRKQNITIPEKFKINDISILTSLLRGIFDTDGNIHFQSKYGYKNYYPHISIGQKSEKLIKDINSILKMLGFNPNPCLNRDCWTLDLYGYKSLDRYMELIGFNNPKHLRKINEWRKRYPKLHGGRGVVWQHRGHF